MQADQGKDAIDPCPDINVIDTEYEGGHQKESLEYAHADAHLKKPVDGKELDTVKILLEKASRA